MRISDWSSDVCSSDLLQRYRVLLDPGAGRMVLAPGRTATAPPLKSTSGLLVRADGRRLDVLHVMRGSPAAATGWQGGEAICSIAGKESPQDYRRRALAVYARKSGVWGRGVSVSVGLGGHR